VSQTDLSGLALWAIVKSFLSEKVSVVLWLFLFKGGEVLEAVFLLEGFLGSSGQNRPDRFAKLV
jgi:hypothetical protein